MNTYYAHPKAIYEREREKIEVDFLSKNGFDVFNPKNMCPGKKGKDYLKPFLKMVDKCDCVVVSQLNTVDNFITRGVFDEARHGLSRNKPVFVIRYMENGSPTLYLLENVVLYDTMQWAGAYGKTIVRGDRRNE